MIPSRHDLHQLAAVLLTVLGLGCAVATTTAAFGSIVAGQERTREAVGAAFDQRDAYVALLEEETGVEVYVATGDPRFLEPYRAGRAAYAAYRAHRTEPAGTGASALARFRRDGEGLQPYFASQVAAVANGDRVRATARLPAGKVAFDELRRSHADASRSLRTALQAQRSAVDDAVRTAHTATLAMALVLIAAGVLSTILAVRARRYAGLARRDELTELPNRRAFEERLGSELASRRPDEFVALLYVDLDGFKPVNDRLGHVAGDDVLAAVGDRLRSAVRPGDFVARVGGDEFAAILAHIRSADVTYAIADRISRAIAEPFTVAGTVVRLTGSIGVAVVPEDGVELREIVRAADEAMYRVKRGKRAVPSS